VTAYEYDGRHLITAVTDPAGHRWTRAYDAEARLVAAEDPRGCRWFYRWGAGGLAEAGTSHGFRARLEYDRNGRLVRRTDTAGRAWQYRHDPLGRPTEVTDPAGVTARLRYDLRGQLRRVDWAKGGSVLLGYDAGGRLSEAVNELGQKTRYLYGPCGRLSTWVRPDGESVRYAWDTEPGRLLRIDYGDLGAVELGYDADGRLVSEVGVDGRELRYGYDPAGRLIRVTNAAGEDTVCQRDAAGRLVARVAPDGTESTFRYDPRGLLAAAAGPAGEVAFQRDEVGRVVEERQPAGWVASRYDAVGNRVWRQTSAGDEETFEYDPDGFLRAVEVAGLGRIHFETDPLGRVLRRRLPDGGEVTQSFDIHGQLTGQSAGPAGRPAEASVRRRFRYDPSGRLEAVEDAAHGVTRFRFDPADRLTAAESPTLTESFDWDRHGRMTRQRRGGRERAFEYAAGDRLARAGESVYEYDPDGRLVRRREGGREWEFAWTGDGQLARLTDPDGRTWRYQYDALGRRVRVEGPDGAVRQYLWDGDTVTHEAGGPAAGLGVLYYPNSFVPMLAVQGGRVYSCVADQVGTPRELLDGAGRVVWAARPTAWGEMEPTPGAGVDFPIRFNGQWCDPETGLCDSRFRTYDPGIGRYISPDLQPAEAGFRSYGYAHDPTGWVDPFGLNPNVPPPSHLGPENPYDPNQRATWRGQPGAEVNFYQERGELTVAYVRRGEGPISGTDLILSAHRAAGLPPPTSVVLKNVINQPTLDQLAAGTPPADTLLGKLGVKVAAALGIRNPRVRVEDRRGQTCLVISP
jgi:RHS repeat-associated protein